MLFSTYSQIPMKSTRLTTTPHLNARDAGTHGDVLDGHTTPHHNKTTTTPHGDRERRQRKIERERERDKR